MRTWSYDEAAEAFDAHASKSAWNAYADRPTVLSMLPELAGRRVLDAGCGSGLMCSSLLEQGAVVSAFDASLRMVEIARLKYGRKVEFRVHSLETLSQHYECSYFDLVLSTLVLEHVKDLERVFAQVLHVLKPGGTFLFSVSHPYRAFEDYGQSYFELEPYDQVSPNVGATPQYPQCQIFWTKSRLGILSVAN